jgi:hypothetical protein
MPAKLKKMLKTTVSCTGSAVQWDLDGKKLADIAEWADSEIERYVKEYNAIPDTISLSVEYYYDTLDMIIKYDRYETDAEFIKRIKYAKAQEARNKKKKLSSEEKERKAFERLKKKYG